MLCKLFCQQTAPEADVEIFRRNPLNFQNMSVFKDIVEITTEDSGGRLTRLTKFNSEEAG